MTEILKLLPCPICKNELFRDGNTIKCEKGHSFDIARAGYINLMPMGKGRNAHSGDEREMVRAREEFLSLGLYDKITDELSQMLVPVIEGSESAILCDMGCGEGYHTCRVAGFLSKGGKKTLAVGFDASKYACERAEKRAVRMGFAPSDGIGSSFDGDTEVYFLPGNIFHLPLADASCDIALSMFAPIAGDEARRVLKNGGVLAVISSGAEHLIEMRRLIYDNVTISTELPADPEGFVLAERKQVIFQFTVPDKNALNALFTMTPFYYKTTESGRERLMNAEMPLTLTGEVWISVYNMDS